MAQGNNPRRTGQGLYDFTYLPRLDLAGGRGDEGTLHRRLPRAQGQRLDQAPQMHQGPGLERLTKQAKVQQATRLLIGQPEASVRFMAQGLKVSAQTASWILWHLGAEYVDRKAKDALVQRVSDLVASQPNIAFNDLRRQLGVSADATSWALWHLEQSKGIKRLISGSRHHFIPSDHHHRPDPILADENLRRLHDWIGKRGRVRELDAIAHAQGWGWPRSTTASRRNRLARANVLTSGHEGRRKYYAVHT